MDKTTPRPWKINGPWIIARELLNDGNWHEREVATAGIGWRPSENNNANAELIVKAVNSYESTQAALKALVGAVKTHLWRHDREAQSANFSQCGCNTCLLLRPAIAQEAMK